MSSEQENILFSSLAYGSKIHLAMLPDLRLMERYTYQHNIAAACAKYRDGNFDTKP
jgi:hypothetical protein